MERISGYDDSLTELYRQAEEEGFFIAEFDRHPECDDFLAGVGDTASLEELGLDDASTLSIQDLTWISMVGTGQTRQEAVQQALARWKLNSTKVER